MMKKTYTFIDLFAGIGGFHTAMHYVGGKCVFASEWDKNARLSYEANYKKIEPKLFKKDKDGRYLYFNEDINDAVPIELRKVAQRWAVVGMSDKTEWEEISGT